MCVCVCARVCVCVKGRGLLGNDVSGTLGVNVLY